MTENGAPLFAGDHGSLPMDTRQALCRLLLGPFINADSPLWSCILRDEATLRSRLADAFLDLVIDRDRQVAFTRQADVGELDAPVLQRSQPLTFIESVLLLHLRQRLVEADTQDQRAVISLAEIREVLELYLPAGNDASKMEKRISAAVRKFDNNNVLLSIRGSQDRYEVSPVLRLMFTAGDVEDLLKVYAAHGGSLDADEEG